MKASLSFDDMYSSGRLTPLHLSSDTCGEVVQLREAVFTARARLKQAELEAEQWKEELRRLQAHSQEQGQQIHILRQERQAGQEKTNRWVCLLLMSAHRSSSGVKSCLFNFPFCNVSA